MNSKLIAMLSVGLVTVGIAGFGCTTVVKQGHVGAVYDRMAKGVQDYTLSEGLHFVAPWQKINQFPVSIETVYMSADEREGSENNESITVSCQDGSLNADLAFSYRFDSKDNGVSYYDRIGSLKRRELLAGLLIVELHTGSYDLGCK